MRAMLQRWAYSSRCLDTRAAQPSLQDPALRLHPVVYKHPYGAFAHVAVLSLMPGGQCCVHCFLSKRVLVRVPIGLGRTSYIKPKRDCE